MINTNKLKINLEENYLNFVRNFIELSRESRFKNFRCAYDDIFNLSKNTELISYKTQDQKEPFENIILKNLDYEIEIVSKYRSCCDIYQVDNLRNIKKVYLKMAYALFPCSNDLKLLPGIDDVLKLPSIYKESTLKTYKVLDTEHPLDLILNFDDLRNFVPLNPLRLQTEFVDLGSYIVDNSDYNYLEIKDWYYDLVKVPKKFGDNDTICSPFFAVVKYKDEDSDEYQEDVVYSNTVIDVIDISDIFFDMIYNSTSDQLKNRLEEKLILSDCYKKLDLEEMTKW